MRKSAPQNDDGEKCQKTGDLFSACADCGGAMPPGRSPRCSPCRQARARAVKLRSAKRIYAERIASQRQPALRACIVCGTKFEEAPRRGRPRLTCSAACRAKATAAYLRSYKAARAAEGVGDLFEGGDDPQ